MNNINKSRRDAIIKTAQGVGVFAFSGLIWSAYVNKAKASNLVLRPPAAKEEDEFLKLCIKCGRCVIACPFDTLKLAKPNGNAPTGTPYFTPRETPCYMCVDVPCVPVCPTNALDPKLLSIDGATESMDIRKARMGTAIVDMEACVAYWGIQCDACYRACPLIDEAIKLEYKKNDRTHKHSYLLPVVDSTKCTGCGLCERACITKKAAIMVLPSKNVLGNVDTNYIRGWDERDEQRLYQENNDKQNNSGNNNMLNYLNDEEF